MIFSANTHREMGTKYIWESVNFQTDLAFYQTYLGIRHICLGNNFTKLIWWNCQIYLVLPQISLGYFTDKNLYHTDLVKKNLPNIFGNVPYRFGKLDLDIFRQVICQIDLKFSSHYIILIISASVCATVKRPQVIIWSRFVAYSWTG